MVESMEPVGSTPLYNIHENPNTTLISGVFMFKLLEIGYNICRAGHSFLRSSIFFHL